MPIKIEGLCGITTQTNASTSNTTLYLLLPNFKLREPYSVAGKYLEPHFPRVLLEYDALDDESKKNIQFMVEKEYVTAGTRKYGLVLLDHEIVSFKFAEGSPNLNVNDANEHFIEMKKVYEDNTGYVDLSSKYPDLFTGDIKDPKNTHGVDLASRISINKGILTAEEMILNKYSFDYGAVCEDYKKPKNFYAVLNVGVSVNEITVGAKTYKFKLDSKDPVVIIESLPFEDTDLDDGDKEHDFKLTYKLVPEIVEKRLPTFHKVGPERPVLICTLAWY